MLAVRPILNYNLLRLGLFVAFLGIGYVVGLAGLVLIFAALVGSSLTSYFGLTKQRAAMIVAMQQIVERRRVKAEARAAREDESDEAARRAAGDEPPG